VQISNELAVKSYVWDDDPNDVMEDRGRRNGRKEKDKKQDNNGNGQREGRKMGDFLIVLCAKYTKQKKTHTHTIGRKIMAVFPFSHLLHL
jgi:hypothetical protein